VSRSAIVRRALRAGLVGGAIVVYLALVGMIERFQVRNLIGTQVTLARLLIAAPAFLAGLVAARPRIASGRVEQPTLRQAWALGALTGAVAGAGTGLIMLIWDAIGIDSVRNVFLNASPTLMPILTFGHSVIAGGLILTVGGAVVGAAGSVSRLLQFRIRRPLATGVVTMLILALLQRIVPTALFELGLSSGWLYSPFTGGLTWLGAALVVVAATAAAWFWTERRRTTPAGPEGTPQGRRMTRYVALLAIAGVLAVLPQLIGSVFSNILGDVGIYLLMGLGLNIVVGYAGMLHLGNVAFFAAGAYLTAVFMSAVPVTALGQGHAALSWHLSFYAALPLVIVLSAVLGVLIAGPVLRLRGDYLAIVTLGFGQIVSVLLQSDWLKPVLGGAQGLTGIAPAPIAGISFRNPQSFYYLMVVLCVAAIYVSWRLSESRIGRAWNAMREDEQVAEAMGINTVRYKLLAFALGGAIGSLAGALFAVRIGSLTPTSFELLVSITALAVVILGGMGSIPGVVVGALALIGLPGLLSEFEDYRLLIYGAALVAIMILRPQGLIPNVRTARELKDEEILQDAWSRIYAGREPAPAAVGDAGEERA
jgi:branched-chain amino acid transport system permease protein